MVFIESLAKFSICYIFVVNFFFPNIFVLYHLCQFKYIKCKERNVTLLCFHSSWKAKKQCKHKKEVPIVASGRRTVTFTIWKKTAQYMLVFSTSNFSFDVGTKRKKCSHVKVCASVWCTVYCLLYGRPASRSLNRWWLRKVRWMHIWWRLWVSTQVLSMMTAWCDPYMIFACQLSCYFTVIVIQSLPAILYILEIVYCHRSASDFI